MHIAQPVIMVGWVLIVDASLKRKAGGGDIGYYPFLFPDRIDRAMNGSCAVLHVWVLLVTGRHLGVQCRDDIRIG